MKVIGYVRVSTDRQAEQGVSLEAQEAKIRAMATVRGADLLEVIVDGGESAKNLNRPGLKRLIALVDSGKAEAVIIAKLDRLTRSVKDLCSLLELLEKRGVALVSVAESHDTASAAGRLVITIMAAVSQWEREAIGERTRDALRHKRTRGGAGWQHPIRVPPEPGREARRAGPGRAGRAHRNWSPPPRRPHVARDRGRPEPESAADPPWLRVAAGARGANHQAGNQSLNRI
jgi:DNA invertase Pin-like site-specific DNA recombinase